MAKLDKKGKILILIGLIITSIGIFTLITNIRGLQYLTLGNWGILVLLIGGGIGMVLLPIMKKNKNSKLNFEKKEDDQSAPRIKNSQNNDKSTTTDSEKSRKCKVCETNIPLNEKICPGCSDVYS